MIAWQIRDLHETDIERVVRLYDDTRTLPDSAPINLVDLVVSLRSSDPTMVAVSKQDVIGFVVAEMRGDRATLSGLRIHPNWRGQGIGSGLLRAMEDRLLHVGVRRIEALLGLGQVGEEALIKRGFSAMRGLTLFEKDEPLAPSEVNVLDSWGGELIDETAWDAIAGMSELRGHIEAHVVRPILEHDLAAHFGLCTPSTLMLFGPPGTGKTSFARAIAGRLGWPFVELLPSKLAGSADGLAAELRRALFELGRLEHVVVFIDEFDEIGASRATRPETQGVVNELLKAIPHFRAQPGRLLVCATNVIESLDPAVIRAGRFDLVIPVGPPDADARSAIWKSAVSSTRVEDFDPVALAAATRGFTPADIFLAAQRAAFSGFNRTTKGTVPHVLTTQDFLDAVFLTHPSLDDEAMTVFDGSARAYERL